MSTQNANLSDYVTDTPTPEDCSERFGCRLPALDPQIARSLVEDKAWSPRHFVQEFPNASTRDVNEYLDEHGLDAEQNRQGPADGTTADLLNRMKPEHFDRLVTMGGAD